MFYFLKTLKVKNLLKFLKKNFYDLFIPYFSLTGNSDIAACLRRLETCLEPWDSIVHYWSKTSAHRLNDLLQDVAPNASVEFCRDTDG